MAWSSPQLEEEGGPRACSGTAVGTRGAALTLLQKSMGEVRHRCLWWSLSGFAQHVSAIHLPSANLKWYWKEMCFQGEKRSTGEVVTGKSCFMGMDISWHRGAYLANC